MKVLVTVKRAVDYAIKIRVKSDNTMVETSNIKHSMNPFDEIAIEESVRMKEQKHVSSITALTVGPPKALDTLRTALALGADNAIHVLTDPNDHTQIDPLLVAQII
jgi:electron transfer flavoprotein beta subunit